MAERRWGSRKRKAKILIALAALGFALCGSVQAQDKYLDDQGRVITREQAEAANLPDPWREIVSISPDGHWLLCFRHYGSHWAENYLYRSDDGVRFVPAQKELDKKDLEARRRYASEFSNTSHFETAEDFDTKAWDFFCKVEGVSRKDADIVNPAEFVSWTPDGSRLLFSLTSRLGLTDKELDAPSSPSQKARSVYSRSDPERPGVADWRAYFNLKTQRFELTDELRATNKEARKRWSEGKQLEPTDTRTDEEAQRQKH